MKRYEESLANLNKSLEIECIRDETKMNKYIKNQLQSPDCYPLFVSISTKIIVSIKDYNLQKYQQQ